MEFTLPPIPEISSEEIEKCKSDKNYLPILFKLNIHVAKVVITIAQILPDSTDVRKIPTNHFAILAGHLNRCCRLMLAVNNLSSRGLFGETTRLLMRCIIETSVRVRWLCLKDSHEMFQRYVCDGLKKELVMMNSIKENINKRKGRRLVIEDRMLSFFQRFFNIAGLTDLEVVSTKKLPDFKSQCDDLRLGDMFYTSIQRIGSHSVHGSWSDICTYYVKFRDDGSFNMEDHNARPSENEFLYTPMFVIDASIDFLKYIAIKDCNIDLIIKELNGIKNQFLKIHSILAVDDMKEI